MRTTPEPRRNVLEIVPELAARAKTTIRLHPRRGKAQQIEQSKLGGLILWPENEPWPTCGASDHRDADTMDDAYPEGTQVPLCPVLQLRKKDIPEIRFPPGSDLLQLLWCPLDHPDSSRVAKPFLFWRNSRKTESPLRKLPRSKLWSAWYIPRECELHLERVTELPPIGMLGRVARSRIKKWDINNLRDDYIDSPETFYEWECSTCPGNKVGGYPHFCQNRPLPKCKRGHLMEHLLTLTDYEYDAGTHYRWCPEQDKKSWKAEKVRGAPGFQGFGAGSLHLFICRKCKEWPTSALFLR